MNFFLEDDETNGMEMPTVCVVCKGWFDLNDGVGSTKHKDIVICQDCGRKEDDEFEKAEEIGELLISAEDAQYTLKDANKRLKELGQPGIMKGISDGYHTFGELYEHRIVLYIAFCKMLCAFGWEIWRSKLHSDGTMFGDSFVLGINQEAGKQITYHLPLSKWEQTDFAETLDQAPEWDQHTSNDVLLRLADL